MTIDFDARYSVAGYEGIAFWLKGHPTEQPECQGHPADEFDPMGETFYCDGSCEEEPVEDEHLVIGVMVGDDREHIIDVDDLTLLDDEDYCSVCGQIGCTHDGREPLEYDETAASVLGYAPDGS